MNFHRVKIEDVIKHLEGAKELELSFKKISFYPDSIEEIEQITNPEYFMKGVNAIDLYLNNSVILNDTFFNNINDIRPHSILFKFDEETEEEFELVKILTKIKNCKSLQVFKYIFSDKCSLSFKDTPILVKSNKFDPIFVECKNFNCEIVMSQLNQQFWFTKDKSFMHIVESFDFKLNDFQACSIEENKLFKNIFSTQLSKSNDEQELIIPMSYLNSVNINDDAESDNNNIFNKEFIKKICNSPKITYEIHFSKFLRNINQFCSLHLNN